MASKYGVNELFNTIQGEGVLTGRPATFIRLQGCTVGCPWCDTEYTWKAGGVGTMTAQAIIERISSEEVGGLLPLAVITGGEPTIYNLDDLLIALQTAGQLKWGHDFRTQMETSGQNAFKGGFRPDYVTWSPKRNLGFDAPDEIKQSATEVKWVVDDDLHYSTVYDRMSEVYKVSLRIPHCVLMPEGCPPSQAHIDKALEWLRMSPTWRMCDRLQWRINVK